MIFLPVVALLYWRTTGSARLTLVVIASFFFYMSWLPAYGLLLFAMTAANWILALLLERAKEKNPQGVALKLYFLTGLALNLGCLCYYKYANFFLSNIAAAFNFVIQAPAWQAPVLDIILPLGISFFVFEFVHYLVDVYRGDKPVGSFLEFAAFASFFPSQIAGPIKRYQDFVDKLRAPEPFTSSLFVEGSSLIMRGLFKKVAIADPIGAIVFTPFSTLQPLSSADALIAAIGFVIQVYCDFSGYTDIGRGSALLLGIRLPENFQLPYLAHDLADFWRRWHMSLSYWLRDYVYIPLGGSKRGAFGNSRNLFITMVACGLWHGASWHYVVFGAMQGLGLIANRQWRHLLEKSETLTSIFETTAGRWFGTFLTMSFITVSYAVFRAPDMPHALNILSSIANVHMPMTLGVAVEKSGAVWLTLLYLVFWIVSDVLSKNEKTMERLKLFAVANEKLQFAVPVRLASWTVALILMLAAKPIAAVPFVYFQF